MTENKLIPEGVDLNTIEAAGLYKPFCDEMSNTPMVLLGVEQTEKINRTIKETFLKFGDAMLAFGQYCKTIIKGLVIYTEDIKISLYPNNKIKHLALHSKKARVRKKNRNRILKEIMRVEKWH